MIRFIIFAVASILFAGCNTHFEEYSPSKAANTECCSLTVSIDEEATRTYVEDGLSLCWHADDRLSVFYGTSQNSEYKFTGKTGDKGGEILPVSEDGETTERSIDNILAIYPYDGSVSMSGYYDYMISATLPSEQYYAEDSFGKGANTMVAASKSTEDSFLYFKNLCGYLKIKLYGEGTVKSIKLRSNNKEKISGAFSIVMLYNRDPYMYASNNNLPTITLNCGDGVKLSNSASSPTEFWFVVPPTEFSNGVTITVTDVNGNVFEQTTDKSLKIERNTIQPMKAVRATFGTAKCPDHEIWYTTNDGVALTDLPETFYFLGASILTHTYSDGRGVITFDDSVTKIEACVFDCQPTLQSITIPDSVTSIGEKAFYDCESLAVVNIGSGVKSIGVQAFAYCQSLTNINTLDNVTDIGERAFEDCKGVKSLTMNNIQNIGEYAFDGCSALSEVTFGTNLTTLGTYVFNGCTAITSITLPDSVTAISDGAFNACKALYKITIGSGVKSIGYNAFKYCSSLSSITIPDNVELIEEYAFSDCTILNSVHIGNGVKSIGKRAFEICKGLESITFGENVSSIGDGALAYCGSLKTIFCKPTTPPTLGSYMLSAVNSDYTIYVPKGCGSTYKSADGWSSYESRIKEYNFDGGGESEYDVEFDAPYIKVTYERIDSNTNSYVVILGNQEFGDNEYGAVGGCYYALDIYSSTYSTIKVPNGTYTLSTKGTANTLYEGNSYYYMWSDDPFPHIETLGTYKDATVVVTADGIDAVITMEDGTKHHVTYNGRPSL